MEKKIFKEQTDWTELSVEEKRKITGWGDNRVVAYFSNQNPPLSVKKFKNNLGLTVWKKKIKSSSTDPTNTNQPVVTDTTSLTKYAGEYKITGKIPDYEIVKKLVNFEIIVKLATLYVKTSDFGEIELKKVSDNTFEGTFMFITGKFVFEVLGDQVDGGVIRVLGQDIRFIRKDSTSNQQDQQQQDQQQQDQQQQDQQQQTTPIKISYQQTNLTGEDILTKGKEIKKYVKGDIVKKIQEYLSTLGFDRFSQTGVPDRFFGDEMEKEVKRYQKSTNGDLEDNGIVDDETWTRLVKDVDEKEKQLKKLKKIFRPEIPGSTKIINVNDIL